MAIRDVGQAEAEKFTAFTLRRMGDCKQGYAGGHMDGQVDWYVDEEWTVE